MSALQEMDFTSIQSMKLNLNTNEQNQDLIRNAIAVLFWTWFFLNADRKLTTLRWWIIKKTIYLKDLQDIFVILFGEPPTKTQSS